jgi:hypothetical protein
MGYGNNFLHEKVGWPRPRHHYFDVVLPLVSHVTCTVDLVSQQTPPGPTFPLMTSRTRTVPGMIEDYGTLLTVRNSFYSSYL